MYCFCVSCCARVQLHARFYSRLPSVAWGVVNFSLMLLLTARFGLLVVLLLLLLFCAVCSSVLLFGSAAPAAAAAASVWAARFFFLLLLLLTAALLLIAAAAMVASAQGGHPGQSAQLAELPRRLAQLREATGPLPAEAGQTLILATIHQGVVDILLPDAVLFADPGKWGGHPPAAQAAGRGPGAGAELAAARELLQLTFAVRPNICAHRRGGQLLP